MNSKAYLWHPKYRDFWIICGVENNYLLGMSYVICDRNYRRKEYREINRSMVLADEKTVTRFTTDRYVRKVRAEYGMLTLPSGDQPSLLIE